MKLFLIILLNCAISLNAMENSHNDTNAQATTQDSPLHVAARKGDYKECMALLTEPSWMTQKIVEQIAFPQDACHVMQSSTKEAPEYLAAQSQIGLFMMMVQKCVLRQTAIAEKQRTALDQQSHTPYDCAWQASVSDEKLLNLLTPHTDLSAIIMPIIIQKIGAEGKFNIVLLKKAE